MRFHQMIIGLLTLATSGWAFAQADYHRLQLEIEVNKPAAEVWAKVGDYCDISEWLGLSCEITSGDGGIGTVRVLNGSIVEPMVALTPLSYAYTQPVVEGQYYTLFHGQLEARPVSTTTSRVIYTVIWDRSQQDDATFNAAVERRTNLFNGGLQRIKQIAESE